MYGACNLSLSLLVEKSYSSFLCLYRSSWCDYVIFIEFCLFYALFYEKLTHFYRSIFSNLVSSRN